MGAVAPRNRSRLHKLRRNRHDLVLLASWPCERAEAVVREDLLPIRDDERFAGLREHLRDVRDGDVAPGPPVEAAVARALELALRIRRQVVLVLVMIDQRGSRPVIGKPAA